MDPRALVMATTAPTARSPGPLANGPAILATAVAPTPARLRDLLDTALAYAYETPGPQADGEQ